MVSRLQLAGGSCIRLHHRSRLKRDDRVCPMITDPNVVKDKAARYPHAGVSLAARRLIRDRPNPVGP
jgi:hypothetical protein